MSDPRDVTAQMPKPGAPVIYHLDDGETAPGIFLDWFGTERKAARLRVLFIGPLKDKYSGKPNWFAADYMESWRGCVPECADMGTEPGQWEFLRPPEPTLTVADAWLIREALSESKVALESIPDDVGGHTEHAMRLVETALAALDRAAAPVAAAPTPACFEMLCPDCGKRVGYHSDECGGQCRWPVAASGSPPETPRPESEHDDAYYQSWRAWPSPAPAGASASPAPAPAEAGNADDDDKDVGESYGLHITDYREWQIKAVLACPVAKSNVQGDRADWVWKVAGQLLEDRATLLARLATLEAARTELARERKGLCNKVYEAEISISMMRDQIEFQRMAISHVPEDVLKVSIDKAIHDGPADSALVPLAPPTAQFTPEQSEWIAVPRPTKGDQNV